MNVFSENAVTELDHFGLKPFPILHIREINHRLPSRSITLQLLLNGELQRDEEVIAFCGDSDGLRVVAGSKSYEVGKHFVRFPLKHCSM